MLWKKVISTKYGNEVSGWCSPRVAFFAVLGKFLTENNLCKRDLELFGVAYVKRMRRLSIICWCIVVSLLSCGIFFFSLVIGNYGSRGT